MRRPRNACQLQGRIRGWCFAWPVVYPIRWTPAALLSLVAVHCQSKCGFVRYAPTGCIRNLPLMSWPTAALHRLKSLPSGCLIGNLCLADSPSTLLRTSVITVLPSQKQRSDLCTTHNNFLTLFNRLRLVPL